jgi:hypothetical protein
VCSDCVLAWTHYTVSVRALSSNKHNGLIAKTTFDTAPAVPKAVSGAMIEAGSIKSNSFTVSFSAPTLLVSAIVRYEIMCYDSDGMLVSTVNVAPEISGAAAQVFDSLTAATKYKYKVSVDSGLQADSAYKVTIVGVSSAGAGEATTLHVQTIAADVVTSESSSTSSDSSKTIIGAVVGSVLGVLLIVAVVSL